MQFTHLKIKTEYSLCKSTVKIPACIKQAQKLGLKTLGLSDNGNTFGSLEFSLACIAANIKPIMGCTVSAKLDNKIHTLSFFAQNHEGYINLLNLSNKALCRQTDHHLVLPEDIANHSQYLICANPNADKNLIDLLQKHFTSNNLYTEISRYTDLASEIETEENLISLSLSRNIPLVATNDVYFLENTEIDYESADILRCIGEGGYYDDEKRERYHRTNYLQDPRDIEKIFADIPEAVENSFHVGIRCSFCPKPSKPILPIFAKDENEEMRKAIFDGLKDREENGQILGINNGKTLEDYHKRLEFEISVIEKMGFCGYFLIVSDFVRWSKANDIPVGPGRGSGAGSLVAFCLKITDLDPLYYGLLFERFLNPERVSMPDFDIDFCQEKREQVIEYVKLKYGEANVSAIITFGKLQAKAVLKDVGRVLGLPYRVVDDICKMIPFNPAEPVTLEKAIEMDENLKQMKEEMESKDGGDERFSKLLSSSLKLEGLNRHSSTHAAGIIIANQPLTNIVPLYKGESDTIPAVGYSMKIAETAGLVKFDFLGLKTLTIIANTCKLAKVHRDIDIDITKIDMRNKPMFNLLQSGCTKGIFQLDSTVCRDAMRQMQVDKIEDIIALTSLNRPGPMENIPAYIKRKTQQEKTTYYHDSLREVLRETHGIIIYQEQVMQIAQTLSGYSLGQADLLRRAMGKKVKSEMDKQRSIFVKGSEENSVKAEKASEIFDVVEKFAGYGFNKSHAAAYSVLSLQTAYLKTHYPIEFLIANLNIVAHDTDELNLFIADAKQFNIPIVSPDINTSQALFSANAEKDKIVYALSAIKGIGFKSASQITKEREQNGKFKDILDLCRRVGGKFLNKKQLEALAKSGALQAISPNQKQIINGIEELTSYMSNLQKTHEQDNNNLFGDLTAALSINIILPDIADYTETQKLTNEFESIGFYLTKTPLSDYSKKLWQLGYTQSDELERKITEPRSYKIKMSGIVNTTKQRSGTRGRFCFMTLTDNGGAYETAIFNEQIINAKKHLIEAGKIISLDITATRQDSDSLRIIVNDISSLEPVLAAYANPEKNPNPARQPTGNPTPLPCLASKGGIAQQSDHTQKSPDTPPADTSPFGSKYLLIRLKEYKPDSIKNIAQTLEANIAPLGNTSISIKFEHRTISLHGKYNIPSSVIHKLQNSTHLLEIIT